MKTISLTEFKTNFSDLLNKVSENKESLQITKGGKPIAIINPYWDDPPQAGKLSETLVFEKDIISPVGWGSP